ncbi:hypothetical protein [Brevibacterium picturae]|uniref:DNA-binding protein n=1 Tax=Brevibacterium picturae TaxID=260553 RepID=A0ABN2CX57_9MICO
MTSTDSAAITEWEDRLTKSIGQHKLPITARDIIAVLADAAEPSAPITAADHEFLTTHAGLTDNDLSPQALAAVNMEIASNRAVAAQEVHNESLTTQEVSHLLGTAPPNVRRLVKEEALYSVKTSPNGHHWFPQWQFARNRPLPSLGAVIAALPDNYHPLEVKDFMTEASEELREMSPVEWLSEGGQPDPVIEMADARAWE